MAPVGPPRGHADTQTRSEGPDGAGRPATQTRRHARRQTYRRTDTWAHGQADMQMCTVRHAWTVRYRHACTRARRRVHIQIFYVLREDLVIPISKIIYKCPNIP